MSLARFAQLYHDLDQTNQTNRKITLVTDYIREANTNDPRDAAWALMVLTGQRLKRVMSSTAMRDAAVEASGLPAWLLEECREVVGDTSETLALLLPPPITPRDVSLHEAIESIWLPLQGASRDAQKQALLDAWKVLPSDQRLAMHKLLSGTFRFGVQTRLVARALADIAGVSVAVMTHRLTGLLQPTADAMSRLLSPEATADDLKRPYPFSLAHQLDIPPDKLEEALGDASQWIAEWKWDGVRAQLIHRNNATALWSRGEELLDTQFPQVLALAKHLPVGTVLDGELLAWQDDQNASSNIFPEGGKPLGFAALQTMLGRKAANVQQPSLFETPRVVMFMLFDIIEFAGEDIRQQPLEQRRQLLRSLIEPLQAKALAVRLSPTLNFETWEQAAALRASAKQHGHAEGLMLKRRDSIYHVGRLRNSTAPTTNAPSQEDESEDPQSPSTELRSAWWKWKLDPFTIDAVLIAAQPGSGRRAGLFTDLTFGVWNENATRLVSFAKAYSGLTDEELHEVDAIIRRTTVDRKGPVRLLSPTQVFEIAFQQIQESARHASGVAVRFPRIARWRKDKKPPDADNLTTLRSLLKVSR